MNRPNEGNPFVFFVQLIISTEERINRVVILYTKQRIQGFTMQSDLIKSTPVYRLLKGFSVMKYIRNILVIHLLLFINSFFYNRVGIAEKDEREEPKGIVFLSKLLLLFQYCHICFTPNPEVMSSQTGTLLTIETKCSKCKEIFIWKSQPFLLGKFPDGNLLLSFTVLCAGASIKKVLLVFRHMGILVYNEPTYYYHQRHLLIPTVISFWRKYQKKNPRLSERKRGCVGWRWAP